MPQMPAASARRAALHSLVLGSTSSVLRLLHTSTRWPSIVVCAAETVLNLCTSTPTSHHSLMTYRHLLLTYTDHKSHPCTSCPVLPPCHRELKDFLRTGSRQVTYADVKRLGFGYGEWASERERQEAIHQLDGRTVDGCTVRVRAVEGDEELEGPGPGAYGGSRSMGSMGLGSGMGMGGRPMDSGYGMRGGMDSYRGVWTSSWLVPMWMSCGRTMT